VGVGASGAILGVFGAFVPYNYRRRHRAVAAARLRAATTLVVLNMILAFTIPGIDYRAHIGGFLAGLIAGWAAEGVGSRSSRRAILVLGFGGLVAIGVALVAWHTAELRDAFGLPG
jgi:membrane associated rhomboid family serine protease